MHVFDVWGSGHDRGRKIGQAFAPLIAKSLPTMPVDEGAARKWRALRDAMRAYLTERFPDAVDEVRGIAEGAGIAFDAAFLKSVANSISPAAHAACTSIAFAASDAGPILGKTDDGMLPAKEATPEIAAQRTRERLDNLLVLTTRPAKGYAVLCVCPPGTVWAETGINEKGLCMGSSSGHPTMRGQDGYGLPQHVACRLVLTHCATVAEAIDFFKSHRLAGKGINMSFADAQGHVAAIESVFTRVGVRQPNNAVTYAVNHYFAPEMQELMPQHDPAFITSNYFLNSVSRAVRLRATLQDHPRELTFDLMKQTLSDHHNPGAVCQHVDNNDAHALTHFAAILVPQRREMWVNEGPPCRLSYVKHTLRT